MVTSEKFYVLYLRHYKDNDNDKWQWQNISKFQYGFKIHNNNSTEGKSLETVLAKKYNFNIKTCKIFSDHPSS